MKPATFAEYSEAFDCAKMIRRDGILQITLHTENDSFSWRSQTKRELTHLLSVIGDDPETRVIILTGTGDDFIRPGLTVKSPETAGQVDGRQWGTRNLPEGKRLLMAHLDIQVPMIAAMNGPATMHAELALLCDSVLATDRVMLQDSLHFRKGVLPGDGAHIVWPALLGINRARYFLLTGESIPAGEARKLGLIHEILPADRLLDRAWELAASIAEAPPLTGRLFRETMLQPLKRAVIADLGYGLALEGLAASEYWPF